MEQQEKDNSNDTVANDLYQLQQHPDTSDDYVLVSSLSNNNVNEKDNISSDSEIAAATSSYKTSLTAEAKRLNNAINREENQEEGEEHNKKARNEDISSSLSMAVAATSINDEHHSNNSNFVQGTLPKLVVKSIMQIELLSSNYIDQILLPKEFISDADIALLCRILKKKNINVKIIKFHHTNISDQGVEFLSQYLELENGLEYLNLKRNKRLTNASIPYLTHMIERLGIKRLEVDKAFISERNQLFLPLLKNILRNGNDECVKLSNRDIGDDLLSCISKEFKVSKKNSIKEINLSQNKFSSKAVIELFDALKESQMTVKEINLFENNIDDECMESLGKLLQSNYSIESINLGKTKITVAGLKILSDHLHGNLGIKFIGLSSCKNIKNSSIHYLINIFTQVPGIVIDIRKSSIMNQIKLYNFQKNIKSDTLNDINFNSMYIGDEKVIKLCHILKDNKCKELEAIKFEKCNITIYGLTTLIDFLKNKTSIETLSLGYNKLDDECMPSLGNLLRSLPQLKKVHLESNQFTNKSMDVISTLLNGNKSIIEMTLNDNPNITKDAIPALMRLSDTTCISILGLMGTGMPIDEIMNMQLEFKLKNSLVEDIYYCRMGITDVGVRAMCEKLKKFNCEKLNNLDLTDNKITSKGASMLFDTLRIRNVPLSAISLRSNPIDDDCATSIGQFIKESLYIDKINLSFYHLDPKQIMTDKGIEIISEYAQGNTSLRLLDISCNKMISDRALPALVKLAETTCIENIYHFSTSISPGSFRVAKSLAKNKIKNGNNYIDLGFMYFDDEAVFQICETIKHHGCQRLAHLSLLSNNITSKGAIVLFDTLREMEIPLVMLNLTQNKLNDECIHSLGMFIKENNTLQTLEISNNNITDAAIEILAEYFIGNMTIKKFAVFYTSSLTEASLPFLIQIAQKSTVQSFGYLGSRFSSNVPNWSRELNPYLEMPIDQRDLPIQSNTKSAAKR